MTRRILFLLGTRPEAIKLAPVINECRKHAEFQVTVAVTGQHREMLDQVLDFFEIVPDYDLKIMAPDQTLPDITSKIISSVSNEVLSKVQPDWVVVQGDTTTAMAGAMAAFYSKIKIAHVEAGLRSFDLYSPFPEEMNRVVIGRLASLHFCPTPDAMKNLAQENITRDVHMVGNTVIDAVNLGLKMLDEHDQHPYYTFFKEIDFKNRIILVTCHRRESFGTPFENICKALVQLADEFPDCQIVYPVHLNPNIHANAQRYLSFQKNIKLIDPLPYDYLLWLMTRSFLILTDSGGIQEEAPTLNKPVLVLRNVTERMEGIHAGTAILVGTDVEKIVDTSRKLLTNEAMYQEMAQKNNPYGDGQSSRKIVHILKNI